MKVLLHAQGPYVAHDKGVSERVRLAHEHALAIFTPHLEPVSSGSVQYLSLSTQPVSVVIRLNKSMRAKTFRIPSSPPIS